MMTWEDILGALYDKTQWHKLPDPTELNTIGGGYEIFRDSHKKDIAYREEHFVVWKCPVLTWGGLPVKELFGVSVQARKSSAQLYLLGDSPAEVIAYMGMLSHGDASVWQLCSEFESEEF